MLETQVEYMLHFVMLHSNLKAILQTDQDNDKSHSFFFDFVDQSR